MADRQAVEQALAHIRKLYQTDGYDLHLDDVADSVARIRISAGADACDDCLVSKPVAIETLKRYLSAVPEVTTIELTYPTDA